MGVHYSAHAFGEWLSKDAGTASAWYNNHSSSLTGEQQQFIGLAFARQALRNSDLETAERWAPLVTDGRLRAKLDSDIAATKDALGTD